MSRTLGLTRILWPSDLLNLIPCSNKCCSSARQPRHTFCWLCARCLRAGCVTCDVCMQDTGVTSKGSSSPHSFPQSSSPPGLPPKFIPSTRVLGVDFGRKWTGLAVGVHTTCNPLEVGVDGRVSFLCSRMSVLSFYTLFLLLPCPPVRSFQAERARQIWQSVLCR